MTSTKLASLAIVLSILALFYSVVNTPAPVSGTEEGLTIDSEDAEQSSAIASLDERMTLLERRIDELRLVSADRPNAQRQVASESPAEDPILLTRLQEVEDALSELKSAQRSAPSRNDLVDLAQSNEARMAAEQETRERQMAKLKDMVASWTANALDPSQSESARVKALGGLRGNHLADGTDARMPVVDEMIRLAQSSDSASTRAGVWRQMSGLTEPGLKSALLHALANDNSADVREEAAESLAAFLPDSGVESALRNAMDFDSDKGVRDQAEESLSGI